jgi:adenosylcobinamide kinase/adenosylcobinamide-phosphate guanylyltransferase
MQLGRNRTVTLILGGARSGKSRYAQKLASEIKRVTFIATARPSDSEMRRKIAQHRSERPASWETIEAPTDLANAIESRSTKANVIIIDCLTLYLDNVMRAKRGAVIEIERRLHQVCEVIRTSKSSVIVVSNEVGCGVVPAFRSGRRYRDLLGQLNQQIAEMADRVILMVAGMPLTVKDTAGS